MGNLLVIEDDEQIGEMLTTRLRSNGHDVVWERTGRGGLLVAAGTKVDLVLLDLGLPDLDGVEVCRRIREMASDVRILMLTARESEMDVVVGLDAGADEMWRSRSGSASCWRGFGRCCDGEGLRGWWMRRPSAVSFLMPAPGPARLDRSPSRCGTRSSTC